MLEPVPGIYLCHTCRHLDFLYHRTMMAHGMFVHGRAPKCAIRMPWGGRALICDRYEREPGSDDEVIVMEPHALPPEKPWMPPRLRAGRWRVVGWANVLVEQHEHTAVDHP